jgi:hypothetical protein
VLHSRSPPALSKGVSYYFASILYKPAVTYTVDDPGALYATVSKYDNPALFKGFCRSAYLKRKSRDWKRTKRSDFGGTYKKHKLTKYRSAEHAAIAKSTTPATVRILPHLLTVLCTPAPRNRKHSPRL